MQCRARAARRRRAPQLLRHGVRHNLWAWQVFPHFKEGKIDWLPTYRYERDKLQVRIGASLPLWHHAT